MTHRISVGFALLLGLAVVGCKDEPSTCGIPESKQDCDCSDGRTGGEQTCRNGEWTECACPGEPIPQPDGSLADAAIDGSAATSGSGGTGAIDGGSGTGGTGAVDGGAGSGAVDGGAGTGGTGAVDGGSGTGGTGGSFPAAYTGPCTMDDDCGPDAVCFRNGDMTKSYCAPECTTNSTCPAAPAGGNPMIACNAATLGGPTGCQIACSALAMCPTGFTCSEPVLFPNQCF